MNISNKINGDSYIITVFITFFLNSYIIFSNSYILMFMLIAIVRLVFVIQPNQYARLIDVYVGFLNLPCKIFESTQKLSSGWSTGCC